MIDFPFKHFISKIQVSNFLIKFICVCIILLESIVYIEAKKHKTIQNHIKLNKNHQQSKAKFDEYILNIENFN